MTCNFTDAQWKLLESIYLGLATGDIKAEWLLQIDRGVIKGIKGLDEKIWEYTWANRVTQADFDDFAACELFRHKSGNIYTLNAQLIYDTVSKHQTKIRAQRIKSFIRSEAQDVLSKNKDIKTNTLEVKPLFGLPVITKQFQCDVFMVMPFRDPFHVIYNDHIKPLVEALDIEIKLGDNFFSRHEIMTEIWSAIHNSKLLIADCTGKNPNVFYELGIAHTLGRPAIMITQNIDDIPFDVRGKRAILYEYTPRGMKELETKLKSAIESLLNDGEE